MTATTTALEIDHISWHGALSLFIFILHFVLFSSFWFFFISLEAHDYRLIIFDAHFLFFFLLLLRLIKVTLLFRFFLIKLWSGWWVLILRGMLSFLQVFHYRKWISSCLVCVLGRWLLFWFMWVLKHVFFKAIPYPIDFRGIFGIQSYIDHSYWRVLERFP